MTVSATIGSAQRKIAQYEAAQRYVTNFHSLGNLANVLRPQLQFNWGDTRYGDDRAALIGAIREELTYKLDELLHSAMGRLQHGSEAAKKEILAALGVAGE